MSGGVKIISKIKVASQLQVSGDVYVRRGKPFLTSCKAACVHEQVAKWIANICFTTMNRTDNSFIKQMPEHKDVQKASVCCIYKYVLKYEHTKQSQRSKLVW